MKKIFLVLTIAFTMIGNLTEASDITDEQFKKIIQDVGQTKIESHFHLSAEAFRDRFNWFILPIVQDGMNKDDVFDIIHLFEINGYEVSDAENGKVYLSRFDYRNAAFVCLGEDDDDHTKIFSLYYTTPEKQEDALYTVWLLTAFIGSISTDLNAQALMGELTAEGSSGTVFKGRLKFSLVEDGNLNALSVSPAQ